LRIEPAVPRPDGEGVVGADLVLPVLFFLGRLLVRLFVERAGIDGADERDPVAVGAELRRAGAGRDVGDALRLAAGEVEDVDLILLVALALGRARAAPAVRG